MSRNYEKIKRYHDLGLWSISRIRNMVVKGIITAEEFKKITGRPYVP